MSGLSSSGVAWRYGFWVLLAIVAVVSVFVLPAEREAPLDMAQYLVKQDAPLSR